MSMEFAVPMGSPNPPRPEFAAANDAEFAVPVVTHDDSCEGKVDMEKDLPW